MKLNTLTRLFVLVTIGFIITLQAQAGARERDVTLRVLDGIAASWKEADFKAWINKPKLKTLRVGQFIRFYFSSQSPCYLTVVHVNSGGVTTVLAPLGVTGTLTPGKELAYPSDTASFRLQVEPPVGQENIYAICSSAALNLPEVANESGTSMLDAAKAPGLAERIAANIRREAKGKAAVVKLSHRVLGRDDPIQYKAEDVKRYFMTTFRSISRPRLPVQVTFKFDSAELTENAKQNLDEIGKAFADKTMAHAAFTVRGHTDDVGSEGYNTSLSKQRAKSVRRYLMSRHGITSQRLPLEALGETEPIDSNDTEQGRALNRRVEFQMDRGAK